MKVNFASFFLCLFAAIPGTSAALTPAPLPEPVSAALKRAHIPPSHVGVVVQEVDAPSPIIAVNAGRAMNPASTMKLLTTFASLETLGPAYRWKTEAYLNGKLENGVLQGDLIFKGYGDPKLTVEQFWMWLHELRQRGLREIRGDVVLDHGFFEDTNQDPGEFDNDPDRAYNVGTNALLLNFNAMHLHLIPNGNAAVAMLEPDMAGYTLQNNITTSTRLRCRAADTYRVKLDGHVIRLEGKIPANCGELDTYLSLLPHDEYFFAVFSALWQQLGGSIQGRLRAGTAPADAAPFARYVSPQLSEMIRDINKFSNNIMARQLFLTFGAADAPAIVPSAAPAPGSDLYTGDADRSGDQSDADVSASQNDGDTVAETQAQAPAPLPAPSATDAQPKGSVSRSIAKMQQWLTTHQLQFPELVLENGSGLSRKERISALHLARLLQQVTHSPFSAELEASLPILGMDGTVRRRFKDSELAGHAHLKTGTLDGVKSMAGYVDARNGKKWIVVFIINHPNAARGQAAQDALIAWLQQQNQH